MQSLHLDLKKKLIDIELLYLLNEITLELFIKKKFLLKKKKKFCDKNKKNKKFFKKKYCIFRIITYSFIEW